VAWWSLVAVLALGGVAVLIAGAIVKRGAGPAPAVTAGARGRLREAALVFTDAETLRAWRARAERGGPVLAVEPRKVARCLATAGIPVEVLALVRLADGLALEIRVLEGPAAGCRGLILPTQFKPA
jgi:hypothetical protein